MDEFGDDVVAEIIRWIAGDAPSIAALRLVSKRVKRLADGAVWRLKVSGTEVEFDECSRLTFVVETFPGLLSLNLRQTNVSDLAPLSAVFGLTSLNLRKCKGVRDIGPLSACTALQVLDLSLCDVEDIGPLSSCRALWHLDISVTHVAALGTLATLGGTLRHLNLQNCVRITDFAPLSALTSLRHLDISDCLLVASIAPLTACVALEHLNISECHRIADLTPLSASRGTFRELCARGCINLANLAPLSACVALERLIIDRCYQVRDLSPLSACVALEHLGIDRCVSVARGDLLPDHPLTGRSAVQDYIRVVSSYRM
jgi:Leucine-rich repeat (LRR) protein